MIMSEPNSPHSDTESKPSLSFDPYQVNDEFRMFIKIMMNELLNTDRLTTDYKNAVEATVPTPSSTQSMYVSGVCYPTVYNCSHQKSCTLDPHPHVQKQLEIYDEKLWVQLTDQSLAFITECWFRILELWNGHPSITIANSERHANVRLAWEYAWCYLPLLSLDVIRALSLHVFQQSQKETLGCYCYYRWLLEVLSSDWNLKTSTITERDHDGIIPYSLPALCAPLDAADLLLQDYFPSPMRFQMFKYVADSLLSFRNTNKIMFEWCERSDDNNDDTSHNLSDVGYVYLWSYCTMIESDQGDAKPFRLDINRLHAVFMAPSSNNNDADEPEIDDHVKLSQLFNDMSSFVNALFSRIRKVGDWKLSLFTRLQQNVYDANVIDTTSFVDLLHRYLCDILDNYQEDGIDGSSLVGLLAASEDCIRNCILLETKDVEKQTFMQYRMYSIWLHGIRIRLLPVVETILNSIRSDLNRWEQGATPNIDNLIVEVVRCAILVNAVMYDNLPKKKASFDNTNVLLQNIFSGIFSDAIASADIIRPLTPFLNGCSRLEHMWIRYYVYRSIQYECRSMSKQESDHVVYYEALMDIRKKCPKTKYQITDSYDEIESIDPQFDRVTFAKATIKVDLLETAKVIEKKSSGRLDLFLPEVTLYCDRKGSVEQAQLIAVLCQQSQAQHFLLVVWNSLSDDDKLNVVHYLHHLRVQRLIIRFAKWLLLQLDMSPTTAFSIGIYDDAPWLIQLLQYLITAEQLLAKSPLESQTGLPLTQQLCEHLLRSPKERPSKNEKSTSASFKVVLHTLPYDEEPLYAESSALLLLFLFRCLGTRIFEPANDKVWARLRAVNTVFSQTLLVRMLSRIGGVTDTLTGSKIFKKLPLSEVRYNQLMTYRTQVLSSPPDE